MNHGRTYKTPYCSVNCHLGIEYCPVCKRQQEIEEQKQEAIYQAERAAKENQKLARIQEQETLSAEVVRNQGGLIDIGASVIRFANQLSRLAEHEKR